MMNMLYGIMVVLSVLLFIGVCINIVRSFIYIRAIEEVIENWRCKRQYGYSKKCFFGK